MTKTFDEMDPWENPVIEFDFAGELAAVDTAVVEVTPGGPELLDGVCQISGAGVYQRIKSEAMTAGVNYRFRCKAAHGLDKRVRSAILPVRDA